MTKLIPLVKDHKIEGARLYIIGEANWEQIGCCDWPCMSGQDGWKLIKFLFMLLWTETKVRSVKKETKKQGQHPAILIKQARSIQDSLYGQKITFSCRTNMGDLERAR